MIIKVRLLIFITKMDNKNILFKEYTKIEEGNFLQSYNIYKLDILKVGHYG